MPFMPIRPENIHRYPKDWKQISLRIRERAGNRCENCGVENYSIRDGSKIVLTVAHLDHMPENCADDNLKAWCQRCHNRYDIAERRKGIAERAKAKRAIGDLFGYHNPLRVPQHH
jgi:5-methylcytosine-specific restriction endonuclease McrA